MRRGRTNSTFRSDEMIEFSPKLGAYVRPCKRDGIMVIFGSGAESRPAWTRMVAVVYGSEGGELGFPSAAQ